jgi:MoCo/4Fe-4S cofactor protein with predicted Tat translocation signal
MTGRHSEESKISFAAIREKILAKQGKNYWRSLEEFSDSPEFEEFVKGEFPQHAETWTTDATSRRNFLKIMGASLALAGLGSACVIQPPEKIVPYVNQPEELIPGKPLFYATAYTLGGVAMGLLARSNDGRPTKIEGNPQHPGSMGSTDTFAQASLLTMYDPDRSQAVNFRGDARSWDKFVMAMRAALEDRRRDGGAGVRFLTETVTSPTLKAQFKQLLTELPNAKWFQYEPINRDNEHAGLRMAFGDNANVICKFENADRILSLDADFLSSFNITQTKGFAKKRAIYKEVEHHDDKGTK